MFEQMTDEEALQAAYEKLLQATRARMIWWVENDEEGGWCFQKGPWKACLDETGDVLVLSYLGRPMLGGNVPRDLYDEVVAGGNPSPTRVFQAFAVALGEPTWQGGIP